WRAVYSGTQTPARQGLLANAITTGVAWLLARCEAILARPEFRRGLRAGTPRLAPPPGRGRPRHHHHPPQTPPLPGLPHAPPGAPGRGRRGSLRESRLRFRAGAGGVRGAGGAGGQPGAVTYSAGWFLGGRPRGLLDGQCGASTSRRRWGSAARAGRVARRKPSRVRPLGRWRRAAAISSGAGRTVVVGSLVLGRMVLRIVRGY